jgi:hypothetical protein
VAAGPPPAPAGRPGGAGLVAQIAKMQVDLRELRLAPRSEPGRPWLTAVRNVSDRIAGGDRQKARGYRLQNTPVQSMVDSGAAMPWAAR